MVHCLLLSVEPAFEVSVALIGRLARHSLASARPETCYSLDSFLGNTVHVRLITTPELLVFEQPD